jgi:Domain of unknown function (DUF4265)
LTGDTARLANVPFLQDGVAEGEIVRFATRAESLHWALERVEASGNCAVRVIPIPAGPLGTSARAVHEKLAPYGLGGEVFSRDFPLIALTAPAGADMPRIKALLAQGQDEGLVALRGFLRLRSGTPRDTRASALRPAAPVACRTER